MNIPKSKYKSVNQYAKADILQYINDTAGERKTDVLGWYCEIWTVHLTSIFNKSSRRLNKELGITGINKIGNTNGR